jgi:hypothetical protein
VPGVQDGERVAVKMSLPITFRLSPAEPEEPVDVELVKRQIADGTYQFSGRTWTAVSETSYHGQVFDRNGDLVKEGWITFEKYDVRFPIMDRSSGSQDRALSYYLILPEGTWKATVSTDNDSFDTTFVVDEKGNFEKDLRPPGGGQ